VPTGQVIKMSFLEFMTESRSSFLHTKNHMDFWTSAINKAQQDTIQKTLLQLMLKEWNK